MTWSDGGSGLGEGDLRFGGENRGDVLQAVNLLVHRFVHAFIAVPNADRDNTSEEIEILPIIGVVDELAARASLLAVRCSSERLPGRGTPAAREEFLVSSWKTPFGFALQSEFSGPLSWPSLMRRFFLGEELSGVTAVAVKGQFDRAA